MPVISYQEMCCLILHRTRGFLLEKQGHAVASPPFFYFKNFNPIQNTQKVCVVSTRTYLRSLLNECDIRKDILCLSQEAESSFAVTLCVIAQHELFSP